MLFIDGQKSTRSEQTGCLPEASHQKASRGRAKAEQTLVITNASGYRDVSGIDVRLLNKVVRDKSSSWMDTHYIGEREENQRVNCQRGIERSRAPEAS